MAQHCLFVLASVVLFLAFLACGVGFFAPYWLGNVIHPLASSGGAANENPADPYITVGANSTYRFVDYVWRGLWAQCSGVCQWFWSYDFQLQKEKFGKLGE